jgi:hypothetical protein
MFLKCSIPYIIPQALLTPPNDHRFWCLNRFLSSVQAGEMLRIGASLCLVGWGPNLLPLLEKRDLIIVSGSEVFVVMIAHIAVGALCHSGVGITMNTFLANTTFQMLVQPTVYTLHTVLVIDLGVTVPHQRGLIATHPCVPPSTSSDQGLSFHKYWLSNQSFTKQDTSTVFPSLWALEIRTYHLYSCLSRCILGHVSMFDSTSNKVRYNYFPH